MYHQLQRCESPPCPKCGCGQSEILRTGSRWGRPLARRLCLHCGFQWWERNLAAHVEQEAIPKRQPGDAVIYVPVRCPECRSTEVRVTSTRRPIRQHKCKQCGATFKSVEQGDSNGQKR